MGLRDVVKCCVVRPSQSAPTLPKKEVQTEKSLEVERLSRAASVSNVSEPKTEVVNAAIKEVINNVVKKKKAKKSKKYFIHPEDILALALIFGLIFYCFSSGDCFATMNAFVAPYMASAVELCQPVVDVAAPVYQEVKATIVPIYQDAREALNPLIESVAEYFGVAMENVSEVYIATVEVCSPYYAQAADSASQALESVAPLATAAQDSAKYYYLVFSEQAGDFYAKAGNTMAPYYVAVQEDVILISDLLMDLFNQVAGDLEESAVAVVPVAVNATNLVSNSTFSNSTVTSA